MGRHPRDPRASLTSESHSTGALVVRPVAAGDDLAGLVPTWGEAVEAGAMARTPGAVVVLRGRTPVAAAVLRPLPAAVRVEALLTSGTGLPRALEALAGDLRVEISARSGHPGWAFEPQAAEAGFAVVRRQIVVRGPLPDRPPARRPLTFRSYRDVGRRGMVAALSAIWSGGVGPNGLAAALELDMFLAGTDDASLWRVAYHRGELAGVALGTGWGALLYMGVVPERRGQGLGRALHAEMLWALRRAGASAYEDATEPGNAAMQRIFSRAGCEPAGHAVLLVRPGTRVPAPAAAESSRLPLGAHASLLRKVRCTGLDGD